MTAAALAVENFQTAADPRQGLPQYLVELRTRNKSLPHIANHNGDRNEAMSCEQSTKTIGERTKAALERRLYPKTNLRACELAYSLRVSEGTIWNILGGNSKSGPSGRVLFKLVEFFGASFLQEVFGGPNVYVLDPRETRKLAHIQRIRELQAELEKMG